MAYLLDANCFIESRNRYYSFDVCPGFWSGLEKHYNDGNIYSIERVRDEIVGLGDDLSAWAAARPTGFYLPLDQLTLTCVSTVVTWVQGRNCTSAGRAKFMGGADPFLIACALAHNHTVVTHEKSAPLATSKIKIPDVCRAFGVSCVEPLEMLRATGTRFVLE